MRKNNKVLVIAAHPDDEVLGCGGTMARLVKEGNDVFIAILGEGITSRYDARELADKLLLAELHDHSRKVAELIGAKDLFTYDLPDNRFDTLPLLEIVKIVENLIDDIQPDIVYTHHNGDLNIDHEVVFRATMTAVRPLSGCSVRELYSFEVPSSTEWSFQHYHGGFRPNVFVNITDTIDAKINAMKTYGGESRSFPHPRSTDALMSIARRWGSVVGVEYAEAMELIRLVY